jgi:hypothetical protein
MCYSDPNVTFEEYLYYAAITRAQEARADLGSNVFEGDPWNFSRKRNAENNGPIVLGIAMQEHKNVVVNSDGKSFPMTEVEKNEETSLPRKITGVNTHSHTISHQEWLEVSRATRNASWSAVFFLITTDVFGPLTVP